MFLMQYILAWHWNKKIKVERDLQRAKVNLWTWLFTVPGAEWIFAPPAIVSIIYRCALDHIIIHSRRAGLIEI